MGIQVHLRTNKKNLPFCFNLVGAGLAYCVIVTLRISKGGKRLLIVFLLHFTVFHLFLDNGLKHISVDCVKAL